MALLPGFSELFAPPLRSLRNPVGYVHVQHDQFHEIFWTYRSFVDSQYFPVYDQPRLCLSCHFSKTQCCEQPPWPVPPFSYRWQAVVRQCLFQFWIIWYHLNLDSSYYHLHTKEDLLPIAMQIFWSAEHGRNGFLCDLTSWYLYIYREMLNIYNFSQTEKNFEMTLNKELDISYLTKKPETIKQPWKRGNPTLNKRENQTTKENKCVV